MSATLARLAATLDVVETRGDLAAVQVERVAHDSREVSHGTLFCCLPGSEADGHSFAHQAEARGAVALLGQRLVQGVRIPQVVVPDARAAMAPVSADVYGNPSRSLEVVGITGTSGKTTVTHLLAGIFAHAGRPCGVVGTLTGVRTTPEAPELQAALAAFRDEGKQAVAMEVSSHALVRHRVDATRFAVGVFTNLGHDHLDEHRTMEAYFEAKAMLFEPDRTSLAVVNGDDPWGRKLLDRLPSSVPGRPFTMAEARHLDLSSNGSRFEYDGHWVRLMLAGRHNVSNALAAAASARLLGISSRVIAEALSAAGPVPGRYEPIDEGQRFAVVVDYSHKPEALKAMLAACREGAAGGRVLLVFGCGGDRDPSKRAPMGEVATSMADWAVVTNDNPRSEDPERIIEEVLAGVEDPSLLLVEPDRERAITMAIDEATDGDVVLIAGKGHETYQETAGVRVHFDDREVARHALRSRHNWELRNQ